MLSLRFLRLLIILLSLKGYLFAQNLAPNPDFEYYETCPFGFHQTGEPLECIPWAAATPTLYGSSDYFNACNAFEVSVPSNVAGYQYARSGVAYAGLYTSPWREYIMAPLNEPLVAGVSYYVEFWVSPADKLCNIKPIGALFTTGPPVPGPNYIDPLPYTPQIEVNDEYLDNYEEWTPVFGCFIAMGGENYITIGNFQDEESSPLECPVVPPPGGFGAYYFVDDVLVEESPMEEIEFEMGDPVSSCYEYEIDPGIPDVLYHWEGGSTDPSLVVSESGTYTLTITDGCSTGIDSIEVEILGGTTVDIPEDLVTICSPQVYQIELDPGAGSYSWSNGTLGPNITITSSGIYEVEFDNGCDISTDQIEVIINEPPAPFSLGNDFIICPNEEIEYSFDPAIGNFLWQDGSSNSDYTIFQQGVYALTISNDCGEQSDEVEVTALDVPEVELGNPVQFICDGVSIYFSLDPNEGDYLWQDGSAAPVFEILEAGHYHVSVSNECGIDYDEITVYNQTIPTPDLGSDQLLCEGQVIVLNSVGDSGIYTWHDQSTAPEFVVAGPGTYSLSITNDCGTGSDTVVIGFIPLLGLLELGNDFSLCPGEIAVLEPGIENANYLWQDLSTSDTLLISQAGLYSVTVSNQCTSYSDSVNVSVQNDPPDVDLIEQVLLCEGNSITLDAGISDVDYLWSDGSSNSELVITSPGNYALTVSNGCGTDADTVLVIDGGPAPVISLGDDISFCPGDTGLLAPMNQNVINWLWSDGSTGQTLLIAEGGVISVQVSNACGNSSDTLIATLLEPTPTFNLGVDTGICPGDVIILQPDAPGLSLIWSDGTQGEQLEVSNQGIYHATLLGECGVTSDTIEISELPPAPVLDLGPDQSLCPGESIIIDPGVDDVNYIWHDGSIDETFSATQPAEIILIISNSCGQDTDTMEIVESTQGPQVDLGPDILACDGEAIQLSAGIAGVEYLWQDGSASSNFDVTLSGEYILQVSNNCGFDIDTILVVFSELPMPSLGPDTLLCEGTTLILNSFAPPGTNILWQDQSSLPQFEVDKPGLFYLQESNHCGSNSDSIVVTYLGPPQEFDLGTDTLLCPGESVVLFAPVTTDVITWQDGSHGDKFIAYAGQLYSLDISNVCGTSRDEILVSSDDRMPVINLEDEYPLCPEEMMELDVTQSFSATYLWSTGATQPTIEIKQPGEYSVTIFAPCENLTEGVIVLVGDDCIAKDIYVPNIFSPNGDGINDVFEVELHPKLEVLSLHGTIYDRWGNVLYESTGQHFSWDGNFDKKPMLPGVYVFKMEINYVLNGEEHTEIKVGDISLMR